MIRHFEKSCFLIAISRRQVRCFFYLLLATGTFGTIFVVLTRFDNNAMTDAKPNEDVVVDLLKEFDPREVRPNKSVFFVVTSVNTSLTRRVLCSVESSAKAMKDWTTFLLLRDAPPLNSSDDITTPLVIRYPNINVRRYDPGKILELVDLDILYRTNLQDNPSLALYHLSDLMRLTLLYLYGGISFDTDVFVQKSLESLPDCLAKQDNTYVSVAVMKFHLRHPFLSTWLENIHLNFNSGQWGSLGQILVTQLLKEECDVPDVKTLHLKQDSCGNGIPKIMSEAYFNPVPYTQHMRFIQSKDANETIQMVKYSYSVHTFNKMHPDLQPEKDSSYQILAGRFCPTISAMSDKMW